MYVILLTLEFSRGFIMLVEIRVVMNAMELKNPTSALEKFRMYLPKSGSVVTNMLLTVLIETVDATIVIIRNVAFLLNLISIHSKFLNEFIINI